MRTGLDWVGGVSAVHACAYPEGHWREGITRCEPVCGDFHSDEYAHNGQKANCPKCAREAA